MANFCPKGPLNPQKYAGKFKYFLLGKNTDGKLGLNGTFLPASQDAGNRIAHVPTRALTTILGRRSVIKAT
jgi:hypothetical protein